MTAASSSWRVLSTALGYWRDPEKHRRVLRGSPRRVGQTFYRTGDRVVRPQPGAADPRFLGRMDSQVKIRGYRVELGEIEAALRDLAGVSAAVALGWPPAAAGGAEGVVAFLDDASVDLKDLQKRLGARLPRYMVPRRIEVVDAFPLNQNGKIDRNALRARLFNSRGRRFGSVPSMALSKPDLLEYLEGHARVDVSELEDGTELFSSGLVDSFAMVDLLQFLEKTHRVADGARGHQSRQPRLDRTHLGVRREPPEVTMAGKPGIVVLGSPRSGTTLLRRILDAHSNIACPPETYVLSAAARFLHAERFSSGLEIGVLFGLQYAGFAEDDVLARLRRFAFSFFEEHAATQGKPRWAEKTAFDAFHVAAISRLCGGHVRFVCLHRHGLDVVTSLEHLVNKTGGYVQELHEYLRRYPEPREAFARAWIDTASAIAELCDHDEHAMAVRYEDLAEDPQAAVRRILEFVDEPWEDGLIERALGQAERVGFGDWKTYAKKAIDTKSVGRWKSLPRPTLAHLAHLCNPTLTRLGYDEVQFEDESDADAKRRYELGLLVNRMKRE